MAASFLSSTADSADSVEADDAERRARGSSEKTADTREPSADSIRSLAARTASSSWRWASASPLVRVSLARSQSSALRASETVTCGTEIAKLP
jgi:hypothetical protein